jgi:hypothetical protein
VHQQSFDLKHLAIRYKFFEKELGLDQKQHAAQQSERKSGSFTVPISACIPNLSNN